MSSKRRISIMKLLITLIFTVALALSAAEKINIDSVPWTDACYFWSMNGKRLPVFNKNLMGNKLSIGGVKYDKGIVGHTPFSVVYNLSGEALSFSAIIGVDDEAHPRDSKKITSASLEIQIIVDREIEKRITVVLGEKAIPIKVDLRGKRQIELRGVYKTGFVKQRVDFANAYFEVKGRKTFLKNAFAWQQKVKKQLFRKINYPAAPKWKNIKIKKVKYFNWNNAYELSNDKCSLIVVPEYGGRILKFALRKQENILFPGEKPTEDNLYKRGICIDGGGNFSRPQPRNYFGSSDPILAYGQYSIIFPAEGEIIMTSGKSYYFGIEYSYHVKLHHNSTKITVITTHKNISSYPHKAGVWSLTRLATDKAYALLMPKEINKPYKKYSFSPANLLNCVTKDINNDFDKLIIKPEFLAHKKNSIEWKNFPSVNKIKLLLKDGTIFRKTFDYQKSMDVYMEKFYPAHVYICYSFIEIETHSPTKLLKPEDVISWQENWFLRDRSK
jgi:NPCBM/NEW2 domain-containing protein